jgi:FAD/FMN-containing dehydrogenase
MQRRRFIQGFLGLAASSGKRRLAGGVALAPAVVGRAGAQAGFPLADLKASLDPATARVVAPGDGDYNKLRQAYNLRTLKTPQAIVLPKTQAGVGPIVGWARSRRVPFSVRGGGHSYEALSLSDSLVIDTRLLNAVRVNGRERTVAVGGGATLGQVYQAVGALELGVPGGSCPTVGVAGNTLGGGFGFLARQYGMACDSLVSVEMVDAAGRTVLADAGNNADLFWACRGAGSGSFGVVTSFLFKCQVVKQVTVFGIGWQLSPGRAKAVMKAWQSWAPNAPKPITSIFRIVKSGAGTMALRCAGLWVGPAETIEAELRPLIAAAGTSAALTKRTTTFLGAIRHFTPDDEPASMKGKSDYVAAPMSDAGIDTLLGGLAQLPANAITIICDAYGGAIADMAAADTAFPHRGGVLYSMQYYMQMPAASADVRLAQMRTLYAAMRPHVSGAAYLNYPDLDLPDAARAYWGSNLARLKQVKATADPDNLFRHAQSVPLP